MATRTSRFSFRSAMVSMTCCGGRLGRGRRRRQSVSLSPVYLVLTPRHALGPEASVAAVCAPARSCSGRCAVCTTHLARSPHPVQPPTIVAAWSSPFLTAFLFILSRLMKIKRYLWITFISLK